MAKKHVTAESRPQVDSAARAAAARLKKENKNVAGSGVAAVRASIVRRSKLESFRNYRDTRGYGSCQNAKKFRNQIKRGSGSSKRTRPQHGAWEEANVSRTEKALWKSDVVQRIFKIPCAKSKVFQTPKLHPPQQSTNALEKIWKIAEETHVGVKGPNAAAARAKRNLHSAVEHVV